MQCTTVRSPSGIASSFMLGISRLSTGIYCTKMFSDLRAFTRNLIDCLLSVSTQSVEDCLLTNPLTGLRWKWYGTMYVRSELLSTRNYPRQVLNLVNICGMVS